jgi:P27 family predicted phage terminase small subunit
MAIPGRKPTPTHIKILRGTRKDRINEAEPVPPPGLPDLPEHLESPAREAWGRMVAILDHMGLASKAEGPVLGLYCEAYARWCLAREEIDRHGLVIERDVINSKGHKTGTRLAQNPAVAVELSCLRLMKDLLVELGLTPSARSRVKGPRDMPSDPFEEFLRPPSAGRRGDATNHATRKSP